MEESERIWLQPVCFSTQEKEKWNTQMKEFRSLRPKLEHILANLEVEYVFGTESGILRISSELREFSRVLQEHITVWRSLVEDAYILRLSDHGLSEALHWHSSLVMAFQTSYRYIQVLYLIEAFINAEYLEKGTHLEALRNCLRKIK